MMGGRRNDYERLRRNEEMIPILWNEVIITESSKAGK